MVAIFYQLRTVGIQRHGRNILVIALSGTLGA